MVRLQVYASGPTHHKYVLVELGFWVDFITSPELRHGTLVKRLCTAWLVNPLVSASDKSRIPCVPWGAY